MLNNKIIIVTGGLGLLGKSIIKEIRNQGGIAINADIKCDDDLENRKLKVDVTNPKNVKEKILQVFKFFGRIDGLVNNAYPRTKDWSNKFEDINPESWRKNIEWQMGSYFYCMQEVLIIMKNQKHGSIVNISSIYGSRGPDFKIYNDTEMTMPGAYSAIKGGINNLTRYLASYYGKYNIRVNSISPGGIFNKQDDLFVKAYCKKVPLGRMANPEDISPGVVFLLSDNSKYITGQDVLIDGGISIC